MKKLNLLLGLIFLTGCGVPYQNRVKTEGREFVEKYPGNKATIQKAISEKRIVPGMTMEEVVSSWGDPTRREEIMIGEKNYEKWVYERKEGGIDTLYFREGILVFWCD